MSTSACTDLTHFDISIRITSTNQIAVLKHPLYPVSPHPPRALTKVRRLREDGEARIARRGQIEAEREAYWLSEKLLVDISSTHGLAYT